MNRSSVTHNIINGDENNTSGRLPYSAIRLNSKLLYRRKSLTDYAHESALSALHHKNDYLNAYQSDPNIFKK